MREAITLQVGQCGNQIGQDFWQKIALEHEISLNGICQKSKEQNLYTNDCKESFFYETEDGKWIPRSISIDLEPRVVSSFSNGFFNPENIFYESSGAGAGNNWAMGYSKAQERIDAAMDIIRREAEASDSLETLILMHSIAGGTGSGFGSFLLETLREIYPKKHLQSFSIFPNNQETSDVVVQPYNSMLTMQRLSMCCDSVLVIENGALAKISNNKFSSNFSAINGVISAATSMVTAPMRFPGPYLSSIRSINSVLIPIDQLKFIVPSYTPFNLSPVVRKTDCIDMLRKLLSSQCKLAVTSSSPVDKTVSIVNILSGIALKDIQRGMLNVLDNSLINFVDWMPPSYHCINVDIDKRCGLSLSNGNNILTLLKRTSEQFDQLKKKNAFIDMYRKFSNDLSEFDECKEVVQQLIDAYEAI